MNRRGSSRTLGCSIDRRARFALGGVWRGLLLLWLGCVLIGVSGCGRFAQRADLIFMNGAEVEPLDPALINAQAKRARRLRAV